MEKKKKASTENTVFLILVVLLVGVVNLLSIFGVKKRFDVTSAERFTLSKGSGNLLQSLNSPMQVDVYVTRGLPKLDIFVRDLRDLLQEYKDASKGKFEYQLIQAKEDAQIKAAEEAGLVKQPFGEASATESESAAVTQGFMGLVFKYGAEKDKIPFLPPDQVEGLEFWITNKIREIRDRADDLKHRIGILTGHDEMKPTEANLVPLQRGKYSIQQLIQQNFPFYTFQDVDLKNGEEPVTEQIDGLLVTQPGKDLNEKELRRLDQFVLQGKSLALFVSAVNVKSSDASMQAQLNTHGLEKLLTGYGVELKKDVVLDFGRSFRVNLLTQGGIASARFPQFLDVQDDSRFTKEEKLLNTNFAGFFRIPQLAIPFASSLVIHPEKQPEAKIEVLARSTPRSIHLEGDQVDLRPFQVWKPKGEWSQYAVAAHVEGALKTAFPYGDRKAGDEIPEFSVKPARVLVLASSQFLANPFARAGNGTELEGQMAMMLPQGFGSDEQLLQMAEPYAQQALTGTILAFKNILDWISGDTDLLAVSAKILGEPSLVYGDVSRPNFDPNESEEQIRQREESLKLARKRTQTAVSITLICGVPLLFCGYGIVRWRMRVGHRVRVDLLG